MRRGVRRPEPPGVRAAGVHAHREVVHGAQRHAGADRLGLGELELLVDHPLQPRLEGDLGPVALGERGDGGGVHVLQVGRPGAVVVAVLLGDRGPGGEVAQRLAVPRPERGQVLLAAGAARRGVHDLQGGALRGPRGVPVDHVDVVEAGVHVGGERLDRRARGGRQRGVLHDPLHPHVERVEEPARGGQVRRGLQRRHRLGGVQRVDQHVVGAELGAGPDGEVGEVDEVADAPGLPRADAVELGGQAPRAPVADRLGEPQPGRCHDQHGLVGDGSGPGPDPVVAQWQVGRHREGRLADRAVTDAPRRHPAVDLAQVASAACLEVDAHLDRVAVGDVHRRTTAPRRRRPRRSAAASAPSARPGGRPAHARGRRRRRPSRRGRSTPSPPVRRPGGRASRGTRWRRRTRGRARAGPRGGRSRPDHVPSARAAGRRS